MTKYEEKCEKLRAIIDHYTKDNIVLAFSGGVDSTLLLRLASDSAKKNHSEVHAVTLHTMLHPVREASEARQLAESMGVHFHIIEIDELNSAGIIDNPVDRCYRCKSTLFTRLKELAAELGILQVIEGTNEDDLHVYRPGIKALGELGILSPLAEAQMSKADVRQLSAELGLSVSDKPSTPCLATRFPYGAHLSYDKLRLVEQAETYIRDMGIHNVRVRVHEDIARIEVDTDAMTTLLEHRDEIVTYLKELGYDYVTVDLEGFRSGSMDIHVRVRCDE